MQLIKDLIYIIRAFGNRNISLIYYNINDFRIYYILYIIINDADKLDYDSLFMYNAFGGFIGSNSEVYITDNQFHADIISMTKYCNIRI